MIVIETNVQMARAHPQYPSFALVLDTHPTEINPEWIWSAGNRVFDIMDDHRRIARECDTPDTTWLRRIREGLDVVRSPSISVGDRIWLFPSQMSNALGYYECMSLGWEHHHTTTRTTVNDVINHHRTHFIDCVDHTTHHTTFTTTKG